MYEARHKLMGYEGSAENFQMVIQKRRELVIANESLQAEVAELKLMIAESDIDRELKLMELNNTVGQKRRIISQYKAGSDA